MELMTKKEIDNMSYRELLTRWRFGDFGDTIFSGDSGAYFRKVMNKKKNELPVEDQIAISKSVGWVKSH